MPRNFYHGKQADIVTASANFASLIAAQPTDYALTPAQATAFGLLNTALQSSYTAAITPETRTPVAIEEKNLAIRNMRTMAIGLAKLMYSAVGTVTDAQLVSLGLLPRTSPTPIPPELLAPILEVLSVTGRTANVRVHQSTGDARRKPIGSAGAQIFTHVGPTAPADPTEYHYEGLATRGRLAIQFPNSVASGATAWIAAAWVSQRGVVGMACTPVQVTIQGGPILAEAA
jgi:hypothetical protein